MQILMCNPQHYGVYYSINPWMCLENATDSNLAMSQWLGLAQIISSVGGNIIEMSGEPGLPDIVFTANAGTYHEGKVVLSNFAHKERQAEKPLYDKQFKKIGIETIHLPDSLRYEGAGDALWGHGPATGKTLWCGHGFRSTKESHDEVRRLFKVDTCNLKLVDPHFYHLDTCFCPLLDDHALIYCGAFDRLSYETLKWCFYLLEVPANEARQFACNAVRIDRNVIIPDGCPETRKLLEGAGYTVFECPMTEFIKSGGACKCLSLALQP